MNSTNDLQKYDFYVPLCHVYFSSQSFLPDITLHGRQEAVSNAREILNDRMKRRIAFLQLSVVVKFSPRMFHFNHRCFVEIQINVFHYFLLLGKNLFQN